MSQGSYLFGFTIIKLNYIIKSWFENKDLKLNNVKNYKSKLSRINEFMR